MAGMTAIADKPRITYGEIRWYEAFTKIKALGPHAKVTAHGIQYIVNWVNDDPAWNTTSLPGRWEGQVPHGASW
jgi:hypothetical protein